jgi:L-iditol 2-dehydrogenase
MKAVVKYAKGKGFVEVREVPEPEPGPGEVRVRVAYAGICASDLHILNDDIAFAIRPPVVMGHEFSGTIDRLGDGVEGWRLGERVVSETSYEVCGACRYCASGFYNLCPGRRVLGYWFNGAFARFTVVPARRMYRLPSGISFKAGALIEPTACVAHGMCELITIEPGEAVLVTGPGAIGLTALQFAKAAGARVLVSGTADDRARLELAVKLGADATVDVTAGDLPMAVRDFTAGAGVDVAVECAGNDRAVRSAIDALRKQGRLLQLGLFGRDMQLAFDAIVYKELKVTGSISSRDVSWRRAIELIDRGDVRPEALVSGELPLDGWEEAFRMHAERKGLKILFKPE